MPELLHDAAMGSAPALGAPKVAVAVSSSHSGFCALKWALENEVPTHGLVYLMHVQQPVRWIPNAMGSGKYPIEQVHPETVEQFKKERRSDAEKLVNQYRRICRKKKIETDVLYSESDSVQKELVDQIFKVGITKLVLGTSQNVLLRTFKVESISAYVAKHAPAFCAVLVVNKEKLCCVRKGTQVSPLDCSSLSSTSETSVSIRSELNLGIDENNPSTSSDIQSGERNRLSGVTDDISISISQRVSVDLPQSSAKRPLSHSTSSNGACCSHPMTMIKRNQSALSISQLPDFSSSTPFNLHDCSTSELNDKFESKALSINKTGLTGDHSSDSNGVVCAHENGLLFPDISVANGSAVVVPEVELLQNQLNEAKLCADRAQREAEWQTNNLKMTQEVVESAKKMVWEHGRLRVEALREVNRAKQQATKDAKRLEEALAALEGTQRDNEHIQQRIAEEVQRHQEMQMELETQKRAVNAYAIEVALAKLQVEAERNRCAEMTLKLEDSTRMLEIECQWRKEAEEKASLEAVAKLDALAALRRERQRYTEYSYEELQSATNDFKQENKLGEGGYGPVYRGKLCHTSVAIKVLAIDRSRGREEFQREVELLSRIRHPHMLMLLGACSEKGCIVYEYMANGSLDDRLNCKDGTPPLPWYARFRICFEVATALLFLHSQPQPVVHRDLKPANILLDHHFVSKIGDVGVAKLVPRDLTFSVTMYRDSAPVGTFAYIDPDYQRTGVVSCESDVYSLGIVMLQLLTGKPAVGVTHLVEEAQKKGKLDEVLDRSAGEWSLEEARKLAQISLQCTEYKRRNRPKLETDILAVLESIQNVAELAAANVARVGPSTSGMRVVVPSFFFCPILQEIMEDPYMAADGFTYEHHAIKVWLQANNTSPMTNLRLDHKKLTPNYTLRSAIQEWHVNGLI